MFMPPKKSDKRPLDEAQLAVVKRWIAEGAQWPETAPVKPVAGDAKTPHWSLQPLAKPAVPAGAVHPVDAFLQAKLRELGFASAPEADRRTLIRRLFFDLTGLPPSPEEVEAFVAERDPAAYERLADRLFGEPALWRTVGAALAGCGPLRRDARLRQRQAAPERLAVSRLRDPRIQRGQTVRAFRGGADRGRCAFSRHAPMASTALGFIAAGPWDFDRPYGGAGDEDRRQDRAAPRPRRHGEQHHEHFRVDHGALRAVPRSQVRPDHARRITTRCRRSLRRWIGRTGSTSRTRSLRAGSTSWRDGRKRSRPGARRSRRG